MKIEITTIDELVSQIKEIPFTDMSSANTTPQQAMQLCSDLLKILWHSTYIRTQLIEKGEKARKEIVDAMKSVGCCFRSNVAKGLEPKTPGLCVEQGDNLKFPIIAIDGLLRSKNSTSFVEQFNYLTSRSFGLGGIWLTAYQNAQKIES